MGERKTYIINIDGMRADYFNAAGHQGGLTPTVVDLARQGIRFTNCKDIMPANTSTNHTAIMTSTHAGSHGILGAVGYFQGLDFNHPRQSKKYGCPKCGFYKHQHLQVPTFYNIIKKRNKKLKTAFIPSKTWIGNIIADEDTDITIFPGNTKETCDKHLPNPDYVTEPEGYVLGGLAHPEDNEILPRFYIPKNGEWDNNPPGSMQIPVAITTADILPSDRWTIDQAIKCVDNDNPDFMYIVLMNMDFAGHTYGAPSAEVETDDIEIQNLTPFRNPNATRDQLYITDSEISRFIQHLQKKGLYEQARIIITADHGMNTMKSMISGYSKRNLFYWLLEKAQLLRTPGKKPSSLKKLIAELDIDIRKILADQGIYMRAGQERGLKWYNPDGAYDWCVADGGPVGYIYNASPVVQEKIKKILQQYTVDENGRLIHPVWKVLIERDMDDEVNEYTREPFYLEKGAFSEGYDHVWPSVIVFLRPHYMVPYYNDQISFGFTPLQLSMTIPWFIDLRIATGSHGTYQEQDVPLLFVSPSEPEIPQDTTIVDQVSVLDILPTINMLNGWPNPLSFEGKNLLPFTVPAKKSNRKMIERRKTT
jgi:predicted AlkP superfamily pyrophosphatase or phosphodiesterase